MSYEERRVLKDSNGLTYFNHLERHMRNKRTMSCTKPTVPKYEDKGCIVHDSIIKSTSSTTHSSLNHQVVPNNSKI